jgi:1-phosphofructokinase/tagatose 6-phosphate kinase
LTEAEELVGHEWGDDEQERLMGVREIVEMGAREAIITLPDGCLAQLLVGGAPRLMRARVAQREPVAPVGAGDAFLAGYVAARYEDGTPEECLRLGVACGAESTARMGAGLVDPGEVERLALGVEITEPQPAAELS